MSRPDRERDAPGSGANPLTATRRMCRAGTGTALAMQAAAGYATLAASRIAARHHLALLGTATEAASDAARPDPDAVAAAPERATAGAAERTRAVIETTGETTEQVVETSAEATTEVVGAAERAAAEVTDAYAASESRFDRFLDAAAPFGHPEVDDRREGR